jgi:hypothetical protein
MSLQDTTNGGRLQTYSIACRNLWTNWLTLSAVQRKDAFEQAIQAATTFMPPLAITPAVISDDGSFSWSNWGLEIRQARLAKNDLRLYKFIDLCGTVYHEARHAEQFYRMAQGLAAGTLQIPDRTLAQQMNEYISHSRSGGGLSFQEKLSLFQGLTQGQGLQQSVWGGSAPKRQRIIARWLGIQANIVQHADTNSAGFATWINLPRPRHYKRGTALEEVKDWVMDTYKVSGNTVSQFGQDEDDDESMRPLGDDRRPIYEMYRDQPQEWDAHAVEDLLAQDLKGRFVNYQGTYDRRRTANLLGW